MLETIMTEDGESHGDDHVPEAVEKYLKKKEYIDKVVNTTEHIHTDVFTRAADELLKDEKGLIDYKRLDDEVTQDQMLDKLVEGYLEKVKAVAHVDTADLSEEEQDIVLHKYVGVTRDSLKKKLREHGSDYTHEQHQGYRDAHVKRVKEELSPLAGQHITEEHLEDIVKYMSAEEVIDVEKMKPTPELAAGLLDLYKRVGALTYEGLKDTNVKHILKKKGGEDDSGSH
jgi:hypothetical protein